MTESAQPEQYIGKTREMVGRQQVNIGPCRRCHADVYRYVDDPVKDERPIHKFCAEREAAGE